MGSAFQAFAAHPCDVVLFAELVSVIFAKGRQGPLVLLRQVSQGLELFLIEPLSLVLLLLVVVQATVRNTDVSEIMITPSNILALLKTGQHPKS